MVHKELIKTKYVKNALSHYATEHLIPLSECDFHINHVDTLVKSQKEQEFAHYSKELLQKYLDPEKIINEHIEFSQIYTITALKKKQKMHLVYSIEFGKYKTHPHLILSPKSIIPYKRYEPLELLKLLYHEINKIKVYNEILIRIFDKPMRKALKNLVKLIYQKKFIQKIKIPLFDGIEPFMARESEVIFWFKQKKNKGMIIEVDKDELLIEYKKPLYGRNGLNAFGKIIDNVHTDNTNNIKIDIDPKSVRIEEDKNTKRYISKVKGYVHFDGLHIAIDNRLRLYEVSRYENIIDSYNEHNNIDIVVTQPDITQDSIGEGVKLRSESIHINGFVGANSHLETLHLEVKGATHQTSQQYARFANINRHKGTLHAHKAKIGLLEGGTVHASKVEIESSIGGQIYAEDVIIGHVKNNLKVYASNSITIHLVSGEDNFFEINYRKIPLLKKKIDFIKEEIEDLKYKRKEALRFKPQNVQHIDEEIKTLQKEELKIENSYKKAVITVERPFTGLNHIIFTIDQNHIIHYKTEDKAYLPFHLQIEEETITLLPPGISILLTEEKESKKES